MKRPPQKQKLNLYRLATVSALLVVTIGLSYGFSRAIADSLAYQNAAELSHVNPTFVVEKENLGEPIPDFTLKDRQGRSVSLSDFASVDLLIVNIWTTNCPVCEAELPSLEELDRRLPSTLNAALITITTNEGFHEMAHLFPTGTSLRILFDPDEAVTSRIFGTSRFPETFILDKNRRIRVRFDGGRAWHLDEMLRFIAQFKSSKS